jgi:hypothetical protein
MQTYFIQRSKFIWSNKLLIIFVMFLFYSCELLAGQLEPFTNLTPEQFELVREYTKEIVWLKKQYSILSMVVETRLGGPDEQHSGNRTDCYDRMDNEYCRLSTLRIGKENPEQADIYTLVTPNSYYSFIQKSRDGKYVLLEKGIEEDVAVFRQTININWGVDVIPFSFYGTPLDEMFFLSYIDGVSEIPPSGFGGFVIKSINEEIVDAEKVVTFNTGFSVNGVKTSSAFSFYRNRHWVLKNARADLVNSKGQLVFIDTISCEYDFGAEDGIPRLKKASIISADTKGKVRRTKEHIITKLSFDHPDISVFDPKQFLPPNTEIGEMLSREPLSLERIICIVFGVILVIFGIWMKLKQKKQF